MESIEDIKKLVLPKALLQPTTIEAANSVHKTCLPDHMIGVWNFPFKLGRESRIGIVDGEQVIMERKRPDRHKPNNDAYILDSGEKLQISREHMYIDLIDNKFYVIDRGSACGTIVNSDNIGGKDKGGKHSLKNGDLIKLGTQESHYIFKFVVLD